MMQCVVVQAGARDQYQLPVALHEVGCLERLVTDFYAPMDRRWFNAMAEWLGCTKHLDRRFNGKLPSRRVAISPSALLTSVGTKVLGESWNPLKNRFLGRAARRLALNKKAAVLSYNYYAGYAFQKQDQDLKYRLLFQMHPHPASVRRILTEELVCTPIAMESLMREHEISMSEDQYQLLCQEPLRANGWIVASTYTANTLIENGISGDRIHVIPYGVDSSVFCARKSRPTLTRPFTIVFVGSIIQRKGLSYLLDAIRLLGSGRVKLRICGRGFRDNALLGAYKDIPVEVHWGLPREDLARLVRESDVMVLPSLVEGFAHVILETMACGVAVITTPNTCGPDVMVDGRHGFIVPIRDTHALAEKLDWCIRHRQELAEMGDAAANQAKTFTWARFRERIREAYKDMVSRVDREE